MKQLLLFFFFLVLIHNASAQQMYDYSVDLNDCPNDQLSIQLKTPKFTSDTVVFSLPQMVPGTYEVYNFGRFVSGMIALDSVGNELPINKLGLSSWQIQHAKDLRTIRYKVEDTWDTELKEKFVFEPAGSNFEAGKNFVLNAHCLYGYFEGMTKLPFRISVTRPDGFYGATSLTDVITSGNTDVYQTADYMQLQDAPIMYDVPDTTSLYVGGADILISVYSPNKVASSHFIADKIKEILVAQKEYLGGSLPIKKYAYLIYLTPNAGGSGSSGALEHSYSSMYFLPEIDQDQLAQTIRDVSAHEFFHIVTPLSIHADQIGNFNYSSPAMSEHLWLYEGTTEYAAGLVQVKYGKMSADSYLKVLEKKMQTAKYFNDSLPFTVMSKGCLDQYRKEYGNVYQKGALIGLCLDIKLRALSDGKYGLQDLMKDLAKTYGKDRSFKDEELFDRITALTYPEIRDFFRRYVEGTEPLPLKETLALVGIDMGTGSTQKEITFGGVNIGLNAANNHLMVVNTEQMDAFGRKLGYQEYDELVKFNGKKISLQNVQLVIGSYMSTAKEGDVLKVTVLRKKSENSKAKKVNLNARVFEVVPEKKNSLAFYKEPTQQQLKIRASWFGIH